MSSSAAAPSATPAAKPDQYAAPAAPPPEVLAGLPHDNGGPKLNSTVWVLTGLAGVFLALRVYCKFLRRRGLWWDDYILIAAWICILIESALLTVMTTYGYGLHIWDFDVQHNMAPLLLIINVAGTFSVTAAVWSKTSFAVTLLRLTDGWTKILVWYLIVSMNIAMGLSALFPWVQCTPVSKAWDLFVDGTCWPPEVLVHYNIFSAAYSALMDITLALLPWKIILGLRMKTKEKIGVAAAMSMGIFAGITAIVKTTKIPSMLSADFADGVDLFIWGNAESTVTIIAASIPILRALIQDARTTRRYYFSENKEAAVKSPKSLNTLSQANTVVVSSGSMSKESRQDDGGSEKSILTEQAQTGKIVRTNDVSVVYQNRRNNGDDEREANQV